MNINIDLSINTVFFVCFFFEQCVGMFGWEKASRVVCLLLLVSLTEKYISSLKKKEKKSCWHLVLQVLSVK